MPPIRFKERGFLAILVAGGPQRAFIFLFFALLIPSKPPVAVILFIWLSFLGILMEIGHQIKDYKKDIESEVKTWVIVVGPSRARHVGNIIFLLLILSILMPTVTLNFYNGLAVSFVIASFSTHPINYYVNSLKKTLD
jgi:4-hydroxybenzoate polyprenyltransferase